MCLNLPIESGVDVEQNFRTFSESSATSDIWVKRHERKRMSDIWLEIRRPTPLQEMISLQNWALWMPLHEKAHFHILPVSYRFSREIWAQSPDLCRYQHRDWSGPGRYHGRPCHCQRVRIRAESHGSRKAWEEVVSWMMGIAANCIFIQL